jgi:hypothetical protein
MITLQEAKCLKYLTKLHDFITLLNGNSRIDKKLAQSMNGTLSHICFVYPHSCAYLTSLLSFVASFESKHKLRWAHPSLKNDMVWWESILSTAGPPCSLVSKGTIRDLDIWDDASTSWGIGICIGNEWDTWQLLPGWKSEG